MALYFHTLPCGSSNMHGDFFSRFLLSRNQSIRSVVHVEVDSVVPLSGCLEASWRHLFISIVFGFTTEILLVIDELQKLPLTRLQTPSEWKNRVLLEEDYTSDLVIPPEDESEKKIGSQVNSSHGRKSSHHSTRLAEFPDFHSTNR